MEHVLTGLDVMPAATHLTCSMLSSSHPSLGYGESQIHTMPYGIDGGGIYIGALDLLNANHSYSLFATGESMGGMKSNSRSGHSVTIKDKSCDLVIMNPPFTRPTKFSSGNAGLASNFMDLGHSKLKAGGMLALVLPFAFVRGMSWKGAREALQAHYSDVHITSIAATGSTERAFSARALRFKLMHYHKSECRACPLSLSPNDRGSVLAVKGSLRTRLRLSWYSL